jgi:hypothetical protein
VNDRARAAGNDQECQVVRSYLRLSLRTPPFRRSLQERAAIIAF